MKKKGFRVRVRRTLAGRPQRVLSLNIFKWPKFFFLFLFFFFFCRPYHCVMLWPLRIPEAMLNYGPCNRGNRIYIMHNEHAKDWSKSVAFHKLYILQMYRITFCMDILALLKYISNMRNVPKCSWISFGAIKEYLAPHQDHIGIMMAQ